MERKDDDVFVCPVARFFNDIGKVCAKDSGFKSHMRKSRVEFLKAIKSFLEEGIERIEGGQQGDVKEKAEKIEVE